MTNEDISQSYASSDPFKGLLNLARLEVESELQQLESVQPNSLDPIEKQIDWGREAAAIRGKYELLGRLGILAHETETE